MKKGGLTTETVEARLRELGGNLAAVARHFGVTRQAVWKFVQARPTLKAAADDVRESMKDHAESALHAAVLRGERWAVCFYLKTQAKDRGYIEILGKRVALSLDDKPSIPWDRVWAAPDCDEVEARLLAALERQSAAAAQAGVAPRPLLPGAADDHRNGDG
jgi:hypothetical protein